MKGGQRPTPTASTGAAAAIKITYGALVPLPPHGAFDFVPNPENWPKFFSTMTSAESLEGWGAPGGKARLTINVGGRSLVSKLQLLESDRPHHIRYIAQNKIDSAPNVVATVNDRRFEAVELLASRRTWRQGLKQIPAQALTWKRSLT
jgi:hypothetical protein